MATTLTTSELADRLDTDPRTLRKFLRSEVSPITPVGKGNRYTVEARKVNAVKKRFVAWKLEHTRPLVDEKGKATRQAA